MIIDELRQLKEQSNMTNQQIADKSGIPASTIARILSGQTDNPSFQTVSDMVKAMGGSLDQITGTASRNPDAVTELYEKIIENKNKWIARLFAFALSMVGVLVFLVLYDLFNRSTGYIR